MAGCFMGKGVSVERLDRGGINRTPSQIARSAPTCKKVYSARATIQPDGPLQEVDRRGTAAAARGGLERRASSNQTGQEDEHLGGGHVEGPRAERKRQERQATNVLNDHRHYGDAADEVDAGVAGKGSHSLPEKPGSAILCESGSVALNWRLRSS